MNHQLNTSFSLQGRCALVTGASSGLGLHFALTLAEAGAVVVVAARRIDKLQRVVDEIAQRGGTAHAVAVDVVDSSSVTACFDRIAALGLVADVVINNAGTVSSKPALQLSEAEWDAVVDTNLKGAWLVAQESARRLVAAKLGGAIINTTSILAERVAGGVAPYCASKAGLRHLTQALALEWARYGIRVNALAPGYIATDLNRDFLESELGQKMKARVPQRRFGQPAQLDGALLLLASDAGSYITGAYLPVDGGHLLSSL
ncbi:MAG: 2-deoxy-D-gluconate 3-dehydrogenase [Hydrocarboniphaga sp.]|uniref:SDR family NAD(P)-dependent oxidoreductase n=1 Tax=Hydrocarboniphaga sp. TaxID=2033016 RepID=UPI0026298D61|nr:SDR family NAD(P)-dependent oxidoreductase [Hydrocarboniphaga sp.]MDB5970247.1 2-deoxy-D-gluconate 3-dehydrogenase [Hydrocarboniphaga sp.]